MKLFVYAGLAVFLSGAMAAPLRATTLQAYSYGAAGEASCHIFGATPDVTAVFGVGGYVATFYTGPGCGLTSDLNDLTAVSGTVSVTSSAAASGLGPGALGNYTGTSAARASYGVVGAAADGTYSGAFQDSATVKGSEAFGLYGENYTINSAGLTGQAGSFVETFSIDGTASILGRGTSILSFATRLNGGSWTAQYQVSGSDSFSLFNSVRVNGQAVSSYPGLTITTTSVGGDVAVTFSEPFVFGTSFGLEVALFALDAPSSNAAGPSTMSSDFYSTAKLTGISIKQGSNMIDNYSILSASGTQYGADGVENAPEPGSTGMLAIGIVALAGFRRGRERFLPR